MSEGLYIYATTIESILVNGKFEVKIYAKDNDYLIYPSKDGKWIERKGGLKCRVFYFITDDRVMMVITQGECRGLYDDGWLLLGRAVEEEKK